MASDSPTSLLPAITLADRHNYAAFFLTLACNLKCPYCINQHGGTARAFHSPGKHLTADDWITAANRLILRQDLPLTLQGGEPTLHPGFYRFVNEVKPEIKMDLMTNLMFDVDDFINNVPVERFSREAPYAAIRASYHPGQNSIDDLIAKTEKLQNAGFRVGIYGIEHPDSAIRSHILEIQGQCVRLGIDFRLKEFLGRHNGITYGTFKYADCVGAQSVKSCECRTTELLVDPAGFVYKCHADLYNGRNALAHILDESFNAAKLDEFRECACYGTCNPCDVKLKTNRFQIFGHTSVEIRNIT